MDLDLRFSKPKNPEKNPDFKFSKISNSGIKILLETNRSDNFNRLTTGVENKCWLRGRTIFGQKFEIKKEIF